MFDLLQPKANPELVTHLKWFFAKAVCSLKSITMLIDKKLHFKIYDEELNLLLVFFQIYI